MGNEDRDQVVEHVKAAYADGRLDKDEMDELLHRAMTARTHAELMPIMTDLYGAQPQQRPSMMPPAMYRLEPKDAGDRIGAGAAHLMALAGLFVIGPLVMLLAAGRSSPYIRKHAVESLNFHLTVLGATLFLPFTVVGIILLPVIWVLGFVLSVVGGAVALTGGDFRYPLTIRMVK